jgi:hypothetical protein
MLSLEELREVNAKLPPPQHAGEHYIVLLPFDPDSNKKLPAANDDWGHDSYLRVEVIARRFRSESGGEWLEWTLGNIPI